MTSQEKHFSSVRWASGFIKEDTVVFRRIVVSYLDRCGTKEVRFTNNYPGKDEAEGFMHRHKAMLTQRSAKNISHLLNGSDRWRSVFFIISSRSFAEFLFAMSEIKTNLNLLSKVWTSFVVRGNAAREQASTHVNYKKEKIWTTWTENGPSATRSHRTKSGLFDGQTFENEVASVILRILKRQKRSQAIIGDNQSSYINIHFLRHCNHKTWNFYSFYQFSNNFNL